jgi:acyl-[acyl-carrier-protein]-phospholipid O-acyltransferase/long-chain-fatty-acid--[acyl-carrier-protein] ligase
MEFLRTVGGEIVAFIARTLIRLLYRIEVTGSLPADPGRMLVISNHQSFLDGVILGAFLPISPTYLVHTSIASQWIFRIPLMFIRHVVVDTTSPLSLKTLIQLIESGKPVVIFPEGRITLTGNLMKIYDGPAFVAARTGCPVVAVHLEGPIHSPFSRMTGDFPLLNFPKMRMTIHAPVTIPMPEGRTAKIRRRKASERMRRIMQRAAFKSRPRKTLFDALLEAINLHGPDRMMLEDIKAQPVSYGTILKNSLALGRLMTKISRERETVGVMMPNVNATVFLLFGMWAMRRTPAMLNYTSGSDALQHACRMAGVQTVVTSRAFVEKAKLGDLVSKLPGQVLYLEDLRPQFTTLDKLWLMLWAVRRPRAVRKISQPEDPAVVLFTSGSEGMPKGVVLSHDSILANTAQMAAAFPFLPKDKFLTALPMFHSFGLTAGVVVPLIHGTRLMLYPSPLHYRTIPEVVYDRDCTVLFSTNTFLGNYVKAAHPYDFYSLRYVIVGAEKLTEDVARLCFEKLGLRPFEGYGATECSPVISANTPYATRMGTVGELMPGIEHQLEPVEGIEHGGVLHVRGDNVMLGYLKPESPGTVEPPSSVFGPGWYNTGDVVTMDDDFVTLTARMKRFAKVAGEMVSLEVVERIAAEAKPHAVHASASIRDSARGETIVLFTEDRTLRREDLQAAARAMGAPEIAVPRRIVQLDKIPLLGNGKKDYVALSRMAGEETAAHR